MLASVHGPNQSVDCIVCFRCIVFGIALIREGDDPKWLKVGLLAKMAGKHAYLLWFAVDLRDLPGNIGTRIELADKFGQPMLYTLLLTGSIAKREKNGRERKGKAVPHREVFELLHRIHRI